MHRISNIDLKGFLGDENFAAVKMLLAVRLDLDGIKTRLNQLSHSDMGCVEGYLNWLVLLLNSSDLSGISNAIFGHSVCFCFQLKFKLEKVDW